MYLFDVVRCKPGRRRVLKHHGFDVWCHAHRLITASPDWVNDADWLDAICMSGAQAIFTPHCWCLDYSLYRIPRSTSSGARGDGHLSATGRGAHILVEAAVICRG